jgi:hypothetical protein
VEESVEGEFKTRISRKTFIIKGNKPGIVKNIEPALRGLVGVEENGMSTV